MLLLRVGAFVRVSCCSGLLLVLDGGRAQCVSGGREWWYSWPLHRTVTHREIRQGSATQQPQLFVILHSYYCLSDTYLIINFIFNLLTIISVKNLNDID